MCYIIGLGYGNPVAPWKPIVLLAFLASNSKPNYYSVTFAQLCEWKFSLFALIRRVSVTFAKRISERYRVLRTDRGTV